jgi:hypothetical protein
MRPGFIGDLLVSRQVTIQFNISQLYLFFGHTPFFR